MIARFVLGIAGWLALASPAFAGPREDQAMANELERLRGKIAGEVQLSAYDLVDELVWGWREAPVFDAPTPVVLAGVGVPVGLGTGLQALLENHVADVLLANPTTNVTLVHCPSCTAVVVHSGPEGTTISRGVDDPSTLESLGAASGKHALFLDIEAEGSWLVLRARLTQLTPDLPIVWSRTIASATSRPALLREARELKSAEQAHDEYLAALRDRGPTLVPVRLGLRTYAKPDGENSVAAPPFVWLQTGFEISPTEARAWTSNLVIGYAFLPQSYQGLMAQARIQRLITGHARSLYRPDIYVFAGAAISHLWGPSSGVFMLSPPTSLTLDPRATYMGLQLGADVRLGHRIGLSIFLENLPAYRNSDNFGRQIPVGRFVGLGGEVSAWF